MHSLVSRSNALVTFSITILAVLCGLTTVTDFFHRAQPTVKVKLARVERLVKVPRGPNTGNDEASLALHIEADLRSVFTWNTKQVFAFVCAEYKTPKNNFNQVSLWDTIIESKEEAVVNVPYARNEYSLVDQGNHLRGRKFNLTVYWNVMPVTGALHMGKKVFTGFSLPDNYVF